MNGKGGGGDLKDADRIVINIKAATIDCDCLYKPKESYLAMTILVVSILPFISSFKM